jgi:hypothetical protein
MSNSRWFYLLIFFALVSCTSQQAAVITTPTLTKAPYPTRTPVITATPLPVSSDLKDVAKTIGEYYETSRCAVNLANSSLDEWLGEPADKPKFIDFTKQLDFSKITIEEIADSANNKYRAYLVVEPNPDCGEDCYQSRVYVKDLSTDQIFRVDWGGYMSWRFIYGAAWFGDKVLTFEQSINPDRVEIVGIDMDTKDYVYHVAYTPKDSCPVETP